MHIKTMPSLLWRNPFGKSQRIRSGNPQSKHKISASGWIATKNYPAAEPIATGSQAMIQAPKLEPRIMRYELTHQERVAIRPFLPNKPRSELGSSSVDFEPGVTCTKNGDDLISFGGMRLQRHRCL